MANEEHLKILNQGVDAWNKWREENPEIKPDLSAANLRRADLSKANLGGTNLSGADLREAKISDFMPGWVEIVGADGIKELINELTLGDSALDYGTNLSSADFRAAADLRTAADLRAALYSTNLSKADLRDADLRKAKLNGVDLRCAKLNGADLSEANFIWADLSGADLSGADLSEANATWTYFRGADLSKANLSGTNLDYAILNDADLREAKGLLKKQLESAKETAGIKMDMDSFLPKLPQEVPRVFLSYAWTDKKAVVAVDQWLRDKGARVVLDDRNFAAGEVLHDEIIRWIEQAGSVVCFVSQKSKDRPYPKLERDIAERLRAKGNAKVIYFNLDDTTLDVAHETRIYIPGHKMEFEEACEKLWQGILKTVQPPKAVDLEPVKRAGKEWTKKLSGSPEKDME